MRIKYLQGIICLIVIFLFNVSAWPGALYLCIDKDGNEIISSLPKDGMTCQLKESFSKPSIAEQANKEYIEQQKAVTEREKAITEQEKVKADTLRIRKPNAECERECKMERSSCESDCARNTFISAETLGSYERTVCNTNCLNYQNTCIDRCYY